jgi:hypothetical protein
LGLTALNADKGYLHALQGDIPMATNTESIMPLLAGMDTVYFSCDLPLSDAMRGRLMQEKATAQSRAAQRQIHCPEWLEARIAPQGAKGGYAFLIETEDFSVKLLGEHIQNRPSLFIEMRSHALHTHADGATGACEAALAWVRTQLYADQIIAAKDAISFNAAKISRADIHIDWQGGYTPALSNLSEELRCFIRPGRVKGALYFQGGAATGIQFGRSQVVARLYNKSLETKEKGNDAYAELLTARCGEAFDPEQDVWRLEFELKREGAKGFRLYASPEEEDPDEEVEAEMSAEELQHIGALPRFFARMEELFLHLTRHWLRLVEESDDANRSRWPTDSVWRLVQAASFTFAPTKARRLMRREQRVHAVEQLDAGAYGYLVSRTALLHPKGETFDVSMGLRGLLQALKKIAAQPEKDFGELVRQRRRTQGLPVAPTGKVLPFLPTWSNDASTEEADLDTAAEAVLEGDALTDELRKGLLRLAERRMTEAMQALEEAEQRSATGRELAQLEQAYSYALSEYENRVGRT